jgi:hypothetical protein
VRWVFQIVVVVEEEEEEEEEDLTVRTGCVMTTLTRKMNWHLRSDASVSICEYLARTRCD